MHTASTSPPGTVINHLPAKERCYLGSPSLAVLPNGSYVATHDIFGPGSRSTDTLVFGSDDAGASWQRLGRVSGQCWSSLFQHGEALYLLGTTHQYGAVAIRRSIDGGRSWTAARDGTNGILLDDGHFHTAPTPTVVHDGRVWHAMEDNDGVGAVGAYLRPFVMSAPADADLLDAAVWTSTNRLEREEGWFDGRFTKWSEGNVVIGPDGSLVNVLRVNTSDVREEQAAVVDVASNAGTVSFESTRGFISFPGGGKKFTIRFDEISGRYWTLANCVLDPTETALGFGARNTLGLLSASDPRGPWEVHHILLSHPSDVDHAFQYADWLVVNDDIIFVSRTAYDDGWGGSHNYHDTNFVTFHVLEDFRRAVW